MACDFQRITVTFIFIKCIHLGKLQMISEKPLYQNVERHVPQNTKRSSWTKHRLEESHDLINNEKMQSYDHMKFILTWNSRINLWQAPFLQL